MLLYPYDLAGTLLKSSEKRLLGKLVSIEFGDARM